MSCVDGESSSSNAECNHSLYSVSYFPTSDRGDRGGGTFMIIFETRECGVKDISFASSSSSRA